MAAGVVGDTCSERLRDGTERNVDASVTHERAHRERTTVHLDAYGARRGGARRRARREDEDERKYRAPHVRETFAGSRACACEGVHGGICTPSPQSREEEVSFGL